MKCDKCGNVMAEIYYAASIYFFCVSKECEKDCEVEEGTEIEVKPEVIALRRYIFSGGYKEPMEEW